MRTSAKDGPSKKGTISEPHYDTDCSVCLITSVPRCCGPQPFPSQSACLLHSFRLVVAICAMAFSPDATAEGYLPPWEVAKAFAFHKVLSRIEEVLGLPAHELLGESRDKWIAKELTLKGGGCPSDRTVRKTVKRCSKPDWYAGKVTGCKGGRPPTYTEAQKARVAQTAMALKRSLVKPTPSGVRAKLPRLSLNKETGEPMSKSTIYRVFVTRCYDETEDDPWVFMRRRRRRRRRRRPGRRRQLPTGLCERLSACRRYCLAWNFIT